MKEARKTIIQRIERDKASLHSSDASYSNKTEYFLETKEIFNKVSKFYFEVIEKNENFLELSNKEALSELERLTHKTEKNTCPLYPLVYEVPAMFRRACINAALGSARSYYTHLRKYEEKKKKAESKGKK